MKNIISLIPGISLDVKEPHVFIQTIIKAPAGAKRTLTYYHRFGMQDFSYADQPFRVQIGENIFSCQGVEIGLCADDFSLRGKIDFSELTRTKRSLLSPNSMGFFAYFPFMQCYHEIVSMSHNLNGNLIFNGAAIDFSGGKGYIERLGYFLP